MGGFNGFPNVVREIRRGKTTRRISEKNGGPRIRLNRSNEFSVTCSFRWILEVLAKGLVGGVNALESLFRFESLAVVALKPVGMPELRRRPIRLVERRLRFGACTIPSVLECSRQDLQTHAIR